MAGTTAGPGGGLRQVAGALLRVCLPRVALVVIAMLGVGGDPPQAEETAPAPPVQVSPIPHTDGLMPPPDAGTVEPATQGEAPPPEAPCRILLLPGHAYPRDHSCLPCECAWLETR